MKGLFKVMTLLVLCVTNLSLFARCSDSDPEQAPADVPFGVTPSELSVDADGVAAVKLTVSSADVVTASVAAEGSGWCHIKSVGERSKLTNRTTVVVAVDANTTTLSRTAVVTVSSGDDSADVTVTQAAGEATDPETPEDPQPPAGMSAYDVAAMLGMGWNLGNQMDAWSNGVANETCWGNPAATSALFAALHSAGIATVRIPVTWLGHVSAAPDYRIDDAWLGRVAELVGMARDAGLNVIINIHHDGADSAHWLDIKNAATDASVNEAVKAQLAAMWTQIAGRFKDEGDYLIFESMNEIHDGGWGWGANRTDGGKQYAALNQWNQTFVDAVRATGGSNSTRWLGVPSYCTNPALALESSFVLPADPAGRLLVAVHFYDPYEYTLEAKYSEWGHTAAADKKESWGDESNVTDVFGKLKSKFVDAGIPVYIGEMGAVHRSDARAEQFRKYYLEYVCKAAHDNALAPVYWDNGSRNAGRECSGLFDRSTGEFLNNGAEIVGAMVKGATSTDPSYTLQSVYDAAP